MRMSNDSLHWITSELNKRDWKNADLARYSLLSETTISRTLNGQQAITYKFCIGVAKAFDESPEAVLRRAGLLPPLPAAVEEEREAIGLLRRLNVQARQVVLTTMRSLLRIQGSESIPNDNVRPRPRTLAERRTYSLAQELEELTANEQDEVFRFMKWVRDQRGTRGVSDVAPEVGSDS